MGNWKEYFGGQYLSAKKLGNKRIKGKIISIETEKVGGNNGNKSNRLVCELNNTEDKLILNRTNCETLAKKFGDDTDNWVNKWIEIYTGPQLYDGKKVKGIFVKPMGGK